MTSLDQLYSVARVLRQNTVKFCARLEKEMKTCRNDDTAQVFEQLQIDENDHIEGLCARAEKANADAHLDVDDIWHKHDLRGPRAREIADNPYLMTPYRAYQLAVINKERVFEILSTLASNQEDDVTRQHAETLAHLELTEIAKLRLRRRQASRSEVETATEKAGLGTSPTNAVEFDLIVHAVQTIIRTMTQSVHDTWESAMSEQTTRVLDQLLEDFPGDPAADSDTEALKFRISHGNNSLFSALKTLLRELEAAVDLFLAYAENAKSEDIVSAAQQMAERYVHGVSRIRDELNLHL